MPTELIFEW